MKKELLSIGPLTIHSYGLMIALGVLAAFFLAERRAKKQGLNSDAISSIVFWCVLGGIIGGKVLFWLTQIPAILADPSFLLHSLGDGFVIYGSILGGIATLLIYCRIHRMAALTYFDLLIPCVALAQGFGRIGCFLAGCCYGVEAHNALCVTFPADSFAPSGIPLVPTQLISSALNFIHFGILSAFSKRKTADGQVVALYLMLYSAGRFALEFFRGDIARGNVGPLSTSQFIGIFLFLAGVILYFLTLRNQRKRAEPVLDESLRLVHREEDEKEDSSDEPQTEESETIAAEGESDSHGDPAADESDATANAVGGKNENSPQNEGEAKNRNEEKGEGTQKDAPGES